MLYITFHFRLVVCFKKVLIDFIILKISSLISPLILLSIMLFILTNSLSPIKPSIPKRSAVFFKYKTLL